MGMSWPARSRRWRSSGSDWRHFESLEPGLDSDDNVGRAARAFLALKQDAPSRHHQLELLRDGLGIV
jgi:hypothetical protein